jgi:hypothetical protein
MGLPHRSSGTTGTAGARRRLAIKPTSSGCVGDELPEEAEHRGRVVHRPPHDPSEHGRAERVQLDREARDDADVAAPTT